MPYHRRSIRLKGYDYAQSGAYFVTICTQQREYLFGDVIDDKMVLNACGEVVLEEWLQIPQINANIELDSFVIMPNHLHGIILILEDVVGANQRFAPEIPKLQSGSLGTMIAQFKSRVTKKIWHLGYIIRGTKLWQRNYYEHIIRNEPDLNRLREYVDNNPAKWQEDSLHG